MGMIENCTNERTKVGRKGLRDERGKKGGRDILNEWIDGGMETSKEGKKG